MDTLPHGGIHLHWTIPVDAKSSDTNTVTNTEMYNKINERISVSLEPVKGDMWKIFLQSTDPLKPFGTSFKFMKGIHNYRLP